jgi:hypothetical protein
MEPGIYLAAGGLILTIGGIVAGRASAWGSARSRLEAVEKRMEVCQPVCQGHLVSRDLHTDREWRDAIVIQIASVTAALTVRIAEVRDELSHRMASLEDAIRIRNGR